MPSIDYGQMVKDLAKDGQEILNSLTPEKAHLLHMAVGMSGEAGELLDGMRLTPESTHLDVVNIVEELGDLEFYLEGLRQAVGIAPASNEPTQKYKGSMDFATNIVCEVSNVLDIVKKNVIYCKELDMVKMVATLTQLETELEYFRQSVRISREETLEANIQKLSVRYASGQYSNKEAHDRADKEEGQ